MSDAPRRRPRICLLTETFYPVIGGGERQAQSLAEDLIARGLTTFVITRRSSRGLAKREKVGLIGVTRVPPEGAGGSKRWLMLLPSFLALVKARHAFDIILVSGFKGLGIPAVVAAKLLGKACVLKADSNGEMSGEFFGPGLRKLHVTPASWPFTWFLALRNSILRRADAFVAITTPIAQEYARHGVPAVAVRSIPNSVDTQTFRPVDAAQKAALKARLRLPPAGVVISYAGRLVSYKGLPLLVRVVEELQREFGNLTLLLIGSGGLDIHNCESALKDYVAARCLHELVRFPGEVANVHEYLQASDAFVLPTEDDAFPLALIEAMACGLPVVSTTVGGIPEIVRSAETGLLVAPAHHGELHAALRQIITDHALATSLGEASRQRVEQRYSRQAIASRYTELFVRLSFHRNTH